MGAVMIITDCFGRSFLGRVQALGLLLGVTFVLASCGGSASSGGGSGAAPTASLTATPPTITAGQGTQLTFSSTGATSGSIDNGVGPVGIASQGNGITVSPIVTTVYHYTVTGPGGSATAIATVTVNPPPPPPAMISFSATPAVVLAGQSVTLSWSSQNADFVVINANVGPSPGRVLANDSSYNGLPAPTQTTIYTAVATTNAGLQSAPLTMTITVNPITSFEGMNAAQAEGGTTEDDIDAIGAIGTKQVLEYTNTSYQGYDKVTFAPVWTANGVSAPVNLGTPWPTGTHCAGPQIQLDADVIFDRMAQRWVLGAKTTVQGQGGFYFCIAVSNTDDLTSTKPPFAWFAYAFKLDPYLLNIAGNFTYLPDWPKLAAWPEANNPAYFAAMDTVNNSLQTENGVLVCAFDRAGMLLGLAQSALKPMLCHQVQGADTGGYLSHSLIPADLDGATPPPAGRDEFMVSIQNPPLDGMTLTSTTINLWDFQLNWSTQSLTLVGGAPTPLTVDSYQPGCYTVTNPAQTTCVQEPGVPVLGGLEIDSVGDRLMPRFSYRNFGAYESFLVSHTVQSPPNGQSGQDARQTGIRWYELFGNGSGAPTVHQQGTITPDINTFRFLPSIAQDKMGNVAVGYSVSNPTTNPGINFSFWNLNDPNGTSSTPLELTLLDGSLQSEEIPYNFVPPGVGTTNLGKWGSYSKMTVDPVDDCTFWYVNEYWPTNNSTGNPATWSTNISNFQIPGCQ